MIIHLSFLALGIIIGIILAVAALIYSAMQIADNMRFNKEIDL